jgi:hypothetical protein
MEFGATTFTETTNRLIHSNGTSPTRLHGVTYTNHNIKIILTQQGFNFPVMCLNHTHVESNHIHIIHINRILLWPTWLLTQHV